MNPGGPDALVRAGEQGSPALLSVPAENCPGFRPAERVRDQPLSGFRLGLVRGLGIVDHYPPLLVHPIKMMDWAGALP
jgi:hypothetical protein